MLDSIRSRLTAWYTLVLATVLVSAGVITYAVARRQILRSNDASMVMTAHQFAAALTDEISEAHGVLRLRSANELLAEFRDRDRAIVLLTADGHEFAAHTTPLAQSLDRKLLSQRAAARAYGVVTLPTGDGVRLVLVPARIGGVGFVIAVGQSLAAQQDALADLRQAMLITIPIALLVASIGGYLLARTSLAPVVRMTAKARAIGATNLSERIDVANRRDELGELAATLNDLLARLDASFTAQRRFMADASHELRSPVAILQGELDVTLSRTDRDAADYRESLEVMRRSVRRLTRIVRDLFLLARSDAGDVPLRREAVYISDAVVNTVRAFRTVAAEREVRLFADCDEELRVLGDEDLIQRLVGNLLENAIKFTPAAGSVRIRCFAIDDHIRIEVADSGTGIPPNVHSHVFERFFRADPARAVAAEMNGSGAGLGLPIARWIAEQHGGTLLLEKSDANGSVFVATLPRFGTESGSSPV